MTSDRPARDNDSIRRLVARRTPPSIALHETQRAMVAVRPPRERRTLTIISGPDAGQVFALDRDEHVLGRGEDSDLRVDDAEVSRVHSRFFRTEEGHYAVEDAGSTNGTFVGADRVEQRAVLRPGDRIQLGPTLVLRYAVTDDVEQELLERMHESATRDHLTRVSNRRHFAERLAAELAHTRRHRSPLSLLLADIDGLRRVNEASGYPAGDILLRAVAGRLSRLVRQEDLVGRHGGDEFVVLARSTSLRAAELLAERLRREVRGLRIPEIEEEDFPPDPIEPGVTLSFGVAALSELPAAAKAGDLFTLAERRLALAKAGGGDRVCARG